MKSVRFQTLMLCICATILMSVQSCTIESASADVAVNSQSTQRYKPEQNVNEVFLTKAVEYSSSNISLAKLAKKKASSIFLKDIATTIEEEHTARLKELKKIASANQITISTSLTTYDKQILSILSNETDFDKKWTGTLIEKHDALLFDLHAFNHKEQLNPQMKQWIGKHIPHFKSHLDRLLMFDESLRFE